MSATTAHTRWAANATVITRWVAAKTTEELVERLTYLRDRSRMVEIPAAIEAELAKRGVTYVSRSKELVIANPRIEDLPEVALRGWGSYFAMISDAATSFDELYPANRTAEMLYDVVFNPFPLYGREGFDDRLFDHYEGA